MLKKIIWMIIELTTIGIGTYRLVATLLVDESYTTIDNEAAGFAAFLIVFGLLIRNWRMTLFATNHSNKDGATNKVDNLNKTITTLVFLVIAFSMFSLNKKVNQTIDDQESVESKLAGVEELESKLSEVENLKSKLSEVEDLDYKLSYIEGRINDLEDNSHYHNY